MATVQDDVAVNGWTAVPVDAAQIFKGKPYIHEPEKLLVDEIPFPADEVVRRIQLYVKTQLNEQTLNHSMRVYYFGMAIINHQFPEHAKSFSSSTLALAALLHDIGTAPSIIASSRMSFEFNGAILAQSKLLALGAPKDQADAVCETIIRHQDLGVDGSITLLGQVIQLATIYDNVTEHPDIPGFERLVHEATRADVNARFPRKQWLGCFGEVIRKEIALKPWCHTTHIPEFDKKVEGNRVMRPFE